MRELNDLKVPDSADETMKTILLIKRNRGGYRTSAGQRLSIWLFDFSHLNHWDVLRDNFAHLSAFSLWIPPLYKTNITLQCAVSYSSDGYIRASYMYLEICCQTVRYTSPPCM